MFTVDHSSMLTIIHASWPEIPTPHARFIGSAEFVMLILSDKVETSEDANASVSRTRIPLSVVEQLFWLAETPFDELDGSLGK